MAGMDRKFTTGAVRDLDASKIDYEGFISPIVLKRFGEYMHKNRKREGTDELRASDNWQLGIPRDAYMKSMLRHVHDVWLHHDGFADRAAEDLETALCGVLFNTMGLLFEVLKGEGELSPINMPENGPPVNGFWGFDRGSGTYLKTSLEAFPKNWVFDSNINRYVSPKGELATWEQMSGSEKRAYLGTSELAR